VSDSHPGTEANDGHLDTSISGIVKGNALDRSSNGHRPDKLKEESQHSWVGGVGSLVA
jgi:hypothetical protein